MDAVCWVKGLYDGHLEKLFVFEGFLVFFQLFLIVSAVVSNDFDVFESM